MKTPRAKLNALLALLNSAAQEAIAEYERTGDVPSTESAHPLDTQPPTLALRNALRILEGACEQLCTTLAPPAHTLLNRSLVLCEPALIRFAVEAKVADILVSNLEGLPAADIAKETGIEKGKLARILRLLATKNCFREVRHEVFANNRLSLLLVSSSPLPNIFLQRTSVTFGLLNEMHICLTDPEYGPSLAPEKSPFMYTVRDEGLKDFFDYLKHHPDLEQLFASGMISLSEITGNSASFVKDFPWNDMESGSTFCDIGSGVGSVSIELAKAHSHLKLTLHDQPQILKQARGLWSQECPKAIGERRVDFIPLDFLKEGPVKNQDIYYMRHILHNWPDSLATCILKNIKGSMKPASRLLIHDHVLRGPYQNNLSDSLNATLAPEPLLANFGAGNIRPYVQDFNMMMLLNAKERSLDEIVALGVEAGLEFVRVWDMVECGMVEFKVVV
jgi:SAM-dependent methyltransferase